MSQPPPTDLEKSLDGLLAGLDNLLASRDRLASAQSIPVDNNAEVGLPSEADWEFFKSINDLFRWIRKLCRIRK